jgi:hypothetical protein
VRVTLALALVLAPAVAVAQRPRVVFVGSLGVAEHRVDDRGVGAGVEVSAGTLFGAGLSVSAGSRWTLAASGRTGVLHPGRGATLPRDVAELGLDGAFMMRRWFDVIAGVRVRSYTTMLARQRWTAPYLGAAARVPFAVPGLRGQVDVTLHPFASVNGLARPEVAISTGAAVAYARGRLDMQLGYALERYDFARGTTEERFEQLSVLTLQVQVRARGRVP